MPQPTRRAVLATAAAVPALRQARSWPRYTNPLAYRLRIPERHPYLALTPDMIEHVRRRAASSPWAKGQLDRIVAEADSAIARRWDSLPPRADVQHRGIGGRLFSTGMAYSFSGNKRYAEWTRDGLLAYASQYPGLPFTRNRHKLFTHSLYEATWVVSVAQAYDLVADSGVFSAEQAKQVENDLLRASTACFKVEDFANDERIKDLHFRCYNFQAFNIAGAGLVGLATRDQELVEWAINSPYGLCHLVGHDINDDGVFWERSEGYHEMVVRGVLTLTEALLHCGVDFYNANVPADRARDEDPHFVTDTSDRPKSLRLMFEPLFYLTFPDLTYPALGDAGRGPLRANASHLIGWHRDRDPKLAWLIHRDRPEAAASEDRGRRGGIDWQWLAYDAPAEVPADYPIREGRFANTGEHRNGCTLFPSTGVAVLRQASGNHAMQAKSTAASLSFGAHGGGHGHSDMLNIVLYAQGRQWLADFGSMPYETHWKAEWTAQSISHNTMVVDGISQEPTGTRKTQWPGGSGSQRVFGVLEKFDANLKAASAHSDTAYDGIRLRRALRLDGHIAVDAFGVTDSKGATHRYDYALHVDGQFEASSVPLEPRSGKLGEICGYQLVELKQRGNIDGAVTLTFANEGRQFRIWIPADVATEVILGDGLTNSPERKMAMLVLRRKAVQTRFVLVFEPVLPDAAVAAVRLEKAAVVIESARGTRRLPLE